MVSENNMLRYFLRLTCGGLLIGTIMFPLIHGLMALPLLYGKPNGNRIDAFYHWLQTWCPDYLSRFSITVILWCVAFSVALKAFNALGGRGALQADQEKLQQRIRKLFGK